MQIGFENNEKTRILLTGAAGQLGMEFQKISAQWPSFNILALERIDFDITLESRTKEFIRQHKPDVVINCAAYTNVERAESERDEALLANGTSVGWLAEVCAEVDCLLIHYSTDYVFDGITKTPYTELDQASPKSVYGESKWLGEKLIQEHTQNYFILRVSWLYSTFGHNFFKTMIRLSNEKEEIRVVNDQIATPTYARLLATHTLMLIEKYLSKQVTELGLYHYSLEGEASWYDFTKEIIALKNPMVELIPVSTAEFPTKAIRPAYSKLSTQKWKKHIGIELPHWKDALHECFKNLY